MKDKSKKESQNHIDKIRTAMLEEAKQYGMNSKQVLKRSEELDALIYEFMKRKK